MEMGNDNDLINFLEETEAVLRKHDVSFRNIKCIRNAEGFIPIADFVTEAHKITYHNGYGSVEIDPTLVIIGSFWWLTRENYDGLEGWVYHKKPKKPTLQAHGFSLKNTRSDLHSSFENKIEKIGGYFNEH